MRQADAVKPLWCRLHLHYPSNVMARRYVGLGAELYGLKRPGVIVLYRCQRCGARWRRRRHNQLRRLEDVLRRS